jgi:hypothetical protein
MATTMNSDPHKNRQKRERTQSVRAPGSFEPFGGGSSSTTTKLDATVVTGSGGIECEGIRQVVLGYLKV